MTVTNDTYITAKSVCELLRNLAALHSVCRSRCSWITPAIRSVPWCSHPARLHIELCFLPTYSPNFNLIERLWKFVKKDRSTRSTILTSRFQSGDYAVSQRNPHHP